jgi:hypothetical protein
MLAKFGLTQLAAQTNGYICVFTGFECYHFHLEEIFLFLMTKCKTGFSNGKMCDLIFGGYPSRWSFGYPWILEYLDTMYAWTLLHKKLFDYVDNFPLFMMQSTILSRSLQSTISQITQLRSTMV